ncbi:hypothetical protein LPJ53_000724 [Coemansia erecta]|uniref:N-acetyltransferase domain-containing protein n=1 Tax=Coemansia erecta TaxID=147472 RepID=A0A9W7Y6H2_9FUNG|nr:hypothetical protein LPJ53_000724 [Coemansia erecta]
MSDDLEFRNLRTRDEVLAAHPLEVAGYTADEAASLTNMLYRFTHAPHLFLVTHASMETHDPLGPTVCIHSVCVAPEHQGKRVASRMLNEYTDSIRRYNETAGHNVKIERLAMLSRENLVPLYERAGYRTLGQSSVVHGAEKWYDCVLDL